MPGSFLLPVRVYYEDTDTGGVVYYANYLKFMERARTEWLRSLGFEQDELSRNEGVIFAVRAARVEYRKPARFNDLLEVSVALGSTGPASIRFEQEVRRDGELLASGEIKIACIDVNTFSPHPIPERIAARVNAWRAS
ncbi:MAG TPA: tol-pal system-associated acyl-CoA thioesterase [Acidiferrobacterales bacterium]